MLTLCIRYTIDPNKLAAFRHYVEAEQEPIRRSGGRTLGYFLPTDFAGPTNEALGLIDFVTLDDYLAYGAPWRTIPITSATWPSSSAAALSFR